MRQVLGPQTLLHQQVLDRHSDSDMALPLELLQMQLVLQRVLQLVLQQVLQLALELLQVQLVQQVQWVLVL